MYYQSTMSWIYEIVKLHNIIRREYNISSFSFNHTLMDLAKTQCLEMYTEKKVFHDNVVLRGGQNILYTPNTNYYYYPEKLVNEWFNSIPHKYIMIDSVYQQIGSFAILGYDQENNQCNNYFVSNYS